MNFIEKTYLFENALKDAVVKKDNTTNILYHLKKYFDYKDIKKIFNDLFDKEILKEGNVLKEEKSPIDKRVIEYRLDELHKLYNEYLSFCLKEINRNCRNYVSTLIAKTLLEVVIDFKDYDLLNQIKTIIKREAVFRIEERERNTDRSTLSFMNASNYSFDTRKIYIDALLDIVNENIDKEKINKEIKVCREVILKLVKYYKQNRSE
jgi:hypothetical protein